MRASKAGTKVRRKKDVARDNDTEVIDVDGPDTNEHSKDTVLVPDPNFQDLKFEYPFPFSVETSVYDKACRGLTEAGGKIVIALDSKGQPAWGGSPEPKGSFELTTTASFCPRTYTGSMKITGREVELLQPTKFLNDEIVNFFMCW